MTAQFSERLIYRGHEISMCANPLNLWLNSGGVDIKFGMSSTACWRGYVGTWKVINDRLYLIGISACDETGKKLKLNDLFPGFGYKVFAHWYSGEVRCPQGKLLKYVHGGYASTYERDLFLKFTKGVMVADRLVVNGVSPGPAPEGYGVGGFTTFPLDGGSA